MDMQPCSALRTWELSDQLQLVKDISAETRTADTPSAQTQSMKDGNMFFPELLSKNIVLTFSILYFRHHCRGSYRPVRI